MASLEVEHAAAVKNLKQIRQIAVMDYCASCNFAPVFTPRRLSWINLSYFAPANRPFDIARCAEPINNEATLPHIIQTLTVFKINTSIF